MIFKLSFFFSLPQYTMSSPFLAGQLIKTSTQRDALGAVTAGTMIYNSTLGALQIYIDGAWQTLANTITTDAIASDVTTNASDILTKQPIIYYAKIQDRKPSASAGGSFNASAWRTRDLNNVADTSNITGLSVASNQITLPAGTYRIFVEAPAFRVQDHVTQLYDITNSAVISSGTLGFNVGGTSTTTGTSNIREIFVLTGTTVLEVQHYCNVTQASNGFGTNAVTGTYSIFTIVMLEKIA